MTVILPVWTTQHVAEFLAALSACDTQHDAVGISVERIAESFDAEICAYRSDEGVLAAVGFPADRSPPAALMSIEWDGSATVDLPGLGECLAISVPVVTQRSAIVLVRMGNALSPDENLVLRGMAQILGLTLQMLGALDRERAVRVRRDEQAVENQVLLDNVRQRQSLLEHLSAIQHAILVQSPLDDVLNQINEGAAALLHEDVVGLRLVDPEDAATLTLVASRGLPAHLVETMRRSSVHEGTGGAAITQGRLVVSHDYATDPAAIPQVVQRGIVAAMAAPVHESGQIVGSLVVASPRPAKRFSAHEQEILAAFAAHASLALTDSRTRQGMHRALNDAVHQALHDPLTGLPNRLLFVDRLAQSLARVGSRGAKVAVLFIDLDNFKVVNDSSGHATGDQLLTAVADRVTECFRPMDTVARFGGDEFAVVVEDVADAAQADVWAARLLEALTATFVLGDARVSIGASIGVVVGDDADTPEQLILNADVAMYHAKALGKGRCSVFRSEMHASLIAGIELEAALRNAIESDELDLAYQPIVDLRTGATVGAEALLRWTHPTRGPISPLAFIPMAEETGLILDIGRWVLERACRDARSWAMSSRPDVPLDLSVNLSTRQMRDARLVPHLKQVLADNDFNPRRLTLEITESVLIDDAQIAGERLDQLKGLGVRLALDDFGTGYSSLSYLQRFPIDIVKIDKSFVDGMVTETGDENLVEAIVNLSQALGLETVAEGVESPEQHLRLLEVGCKLGQGFFFARPMSAAAMDAHLVRTPAARVALGEPAR